MHKLSERMMRIQGTERALRKIIIPEGTIRLDSGEPDFTTPIHIQDAALKAMRDNLTHYCPAFGLSELREAICDSIQTDYVVKRTVNDILVTAGGVEGVYLVVATYIDSGDEVIIPDPEYSAYAETVLYCGGKAVPARKTRDCKIDFTELAQKITERTKMIILSNPCNPTGTMLEREDLIELVEIARKHDLFLVVDEVYHKLVYQPYEFVSLCQVDDSYGKSIILNSFSKTYAMTGWRVGYMVAAENLIKEMVQLHKSLLICVNVPAQMACVAALRGPQDCVDQMQQAYERRRQIALNQLLQLDMVASADCEAAFYFFPRIHSSMKSREITDYLSDHKVLVRSGTEFGDNGEGHIRITFSVSEDRLKEGLNRIRHALDGLNS